MDGVKREQDSLFSPRGMGQGSGVEPLAERMRPRSLEEFIGQDHIVGPGRLLRRAIQADRLSSVIFAGPPGTGKTTLARVIANSTSSEFHSLNAVLAGVAEIRQAIERAREQRDLHGRRTILFVDEVHRWNKAQQDALLPWVENGTIRLIGATTENPWFEVNAALVSRSRIFMLRRLEDADLLAVARQALADPARGYGKYTVDFAPGALEHLVATAAGDARTLLNALELAVETSADQFPPPDTASPIHVDLQAAEESIQQQVVLYDKEGDYHYDIMSAFIKSIRGSDPDGALYWLGRMVAGGESPRAIFRRLLISAAEDIGMADPQALVLVQNAAMAFDRVGMPEGQFFLSQACLYLATAAKSNSTLAYFDALALQQSQSAASGEVPTHLRDASRDGEDLGHGKAYLYPHAWKDHWVAQNYLPAALREQVFYQPSDQGYEAAIARQVRERKWQQLALAADADAGIWTVPPKDKRLAAYIRRQESTVAPASLSLLETMLSLAKVSRHARLALCGSGSTFMISRLIGHLGEGFLTILQSTDADCAALTSWLRQNLPPTDLPNYRASLDWDDLPEFLMSWDILALLPWASRLAGSDCRLLGRVLDPMAGSRPSDLLDHADLRGRCRELEGQWYPPAHPWHSEALDQLLESGAWRLELSEPVVSTGQRVLDQGQIERWTANDQGWGKEVLGKLSAPQRQTVITSLQTMLGKEVQWTSAWRAVLLGK